MKFKDDLVKAAVCGTTGALGAYIFLGETAGSARVPFTNLQLPTAAVAGVACAGASVVSDVAHDFVLPHINKSDKLTTVESSLLQIGTSGLATSGLLIYGSGAPASNFMNCFALGAGSAIGGTYIYDKFISGSGSLLF